MIVEVGGKPYIVRKVQANNPSARGASMIYKVRFNHAQSGQKLDESFRGDDMLSEVDFLRRQVQYLYKDGEAYTFMDNEDYSQYTLDAEHLEGQIPYLTDGLNGIMALLIDGACVGVQIPGTVEMTIVETVPGMKAASASARTKPAIMPTGLEVQVPEYLEAGATIKINTETGEFLSRA